jgi:uncharacterized protein YjbI with pentapeptide repeats
MYMNAEQKNASIASLLNHVQTQSRLRWEPRTVVSNLTIVAETLSGLDLICTDFNNCAISRAIFSDCDLRGASFKNSRIDHVEFVNCLICDMEIPEGGTISLHNCSQLPSGRIE